MGTKQSYTIRQEVVLTLKLLMATIVDIRLTSCDVTSGNFLGAEFCMSIKGGTVGGQVG